MTTEQNKYIYRSLLLAVAAVLMLPVLLVEYVPLVDFPNHLARAYIFHHYEQVPEFQATYRKLFEPIPDLGIEMALAAVLPFVSLPAAGRIYLLLIIAVFVAGCHLLGVAIQKEPTYLALPCCFFVYNSMLLYGMVNYVLGVGLFAVALACWLSWREEWNLWRAAAVTLLVAAAYLTHLTAYGFLGVAFVVVSAWQYARENESIRTIAAGLLPLVPPALFFLWYMRGSGKSGEILWNSLTGKLIGSLSLLSSYDYRLDAFVLIVLVAVGAAILRWSRRWRIAWPTFAAGWFLFFLYLAFPLEVLTSSAADVRMIAPAALLVVLSVRFELPATTAGVLLAVWLVTATLRVGGIGATWMGVDRRIAAEIERMRVLPPNASVYPVFIPPADRFAAKSERGFEHLALYAVTERHATVPTLFGFGGVSIYFREKPTLLSPLYSPVTEWRANLKNYDFVWSYGLDEPLGAELDKDFSAVYQADGFALWRHR